MIEHKEGSFEKLLEFVHELENWKQYFKQHN